MGRNPTNKANLPSLQASKLPFKARWRGNPKGGATNGSDGARRVSTPNRLRGKTSGTLRDNKKPVAEATGEKWWWVYDSNVGRQSQRIYSPPQLATLVTHRKTPHMIAHPHLPTQALFCAGHKKARGRGRTALYGLNVRTNDHARSIPAPGEPRRGTIRRARGGVGGCTPRGTSSFALTSIK